MGDTKISYDEQFGIRTFKREICSELGEPFWLELTDGLVLPDMETEAGCKCCNMHTFICRLEAMADEKTVRKILYRVRHGIHPSQSAWAREEFLEIGDLDKFLQKHLETETEQGLCRSRRCPCFMGSTVQERIKERSINVDRSMAGVSQTS